MEGRKVGNSSLQWNTIYRYVVYTLNFIFSLIEEFLEVVIFNVQLNSFGWWGMGVVTMMGVACLLQLIFDFIKLQSMDVVQRIFAFLNMWIYHM